jgi:hypothetical protein
MTLQCTEAPADAGDEAGLVVEAETINYLLMPRDQNAERRPNLVMVTLKYLAAAITLRSQVD